MKKTLIIYGSTSGSCREYAEQIAAKLDAKAQDVATLKVSQLEEADNLLLGTSSWGASEMQDDWYDGVKTLKAADLKGKTIALFGCGDAESYSDTFCGGMSELYNAVKDSGATFIGQVDASTYTYDDSESEVDGKFIGLALDVNEDEAKSEERIDHWIEDIKSNLED
jgi:flavodoxin I